MRKIAFPMIGSLFALLATCEKKTVPIAVEQFNFNNPIGYHIYARTAKADGTEPKKGLFEFGSGISCAFSARNTLSTSLVSFIYAIVGNKHGAGT